MPKTIALLEELQNLEITLDETKILHPEPKKVEPLEAQAQTLRKQVREDPLARYDRLAKTGVAVAVVRNGVCMGCAMSIPQGDLNRIIAGKSQPVCPNCGRYLALPEDD